MLNTKRVIERKISNILSIKPHESELIFDFMKKTSLLHKQETTNSDNENNLIVAEGLYYINVKITTLIIIAFLMDMKLSNGLAGLIHQISGQPSNSVTKLQPGSGELCIIKEALRSTKKFVNKDILSSNNYECINNDIPCLFRYSVNCSCNSDEVYKILQKLADNNIFTTKDNLNFKLSL